MNRQVAWAFLPAVLLGLGGLPSLWATEPATLQPLLQHAIVGKTLPLAEIERYCAGRVVRMPKVDSAAKWEAQARRLRARVLAEIVYRGEATKWRDAKTRVEWLDTIEGGPGYRIKKLRFEILPGMWTCALLYEPETLSGKVPAVLNVNGHSGEGKVYHPKQLRCINQAKRGMLALNVEWLGMGQLRGGGFAHYRSNQIDLCGTSGLAPFFLSMKRSLDILLGLEHTDPDRVAVTGLSGGGWQTIVISSLDTRVKLSVPVAGYSSYVTRAGHLKDLGDPEQTPCDLATVADYTHLTAMMAPRPTLLIYNYDDNCCFEAKYALQPLVDAAAPVFRLFGKEDHLRTHINHDPGTHNYEQDNRQALYRMLRDFFYAGQSDFNVKEIPSEDELKTAEQLHVDLPEGNQDFHTLALGLAGPLPREADLPKDKPAALAWQKNRREQLRRLVRAGRYDVQAVELERSKAESLEVVDWQLKLGGDWTVPAVEIAPPEPKGTVVLLGDQGRSALAAQAARRVDAGWRVLAIDPVGIGESVVPRNALFSLLVSGVGQRPLGVVASQLGAICRWAAEKEPAGPVTLEAVGPRMGVAALVAAALETNAVARVRLVSALGSLKEVIEKNQGANEMPELFCFGLLERFDVKQLVALAAPRPVEFVQPSARVKSELADLADWYRLWKVEFAPAHRAAAGN